MLNCAKESERAIQFRFEEKAKDRMLKFHMTDGVVVENPFSNQCAI